MSKFWIFWIFVFYLNFAFAQSDSCKTSTATLEETYLFIKKSLEDYGGRIALSYYKVKLDKENGYIYVYELMTFDDDTANIFQIYIPGLDFSKTKAKINSVGTLILYLDGYDTYFDNDYVTHMTPVELRFANFPKTDYESVNGFNLKFQNALIHAKCLLKQKGVISLADKF